jgi:hypothetical protein
MLRPQPFPLPLRAAPALPVKALWVLALCLVGASGCSADLGSDAAYGGQTGSLIPDCLGSRGQTQVVSGDVALASSLLLDEAALLDNNGNLVATELELTETSEGTVIRTTDALTPGSYEVVASCELGESRRPLVVTEAAMLPERLGGVEQLGADAASEQSCDSPVELAFTLDLNTTSYAALVEVRASFDGAEPFVLIPYGAISPTGPFPHIVNLPRCQSGQQSCIPRDAHELVLQTHLAGELQPLPDVVLAVNGDCRPSPADESASCSLRRTSPVSTPSQGFELRSAWPALGLLLGLLARRRGRSPNRNA